MFWKVHCLEKVSSWPLCTPHPTAPPPLTKQEVSYLRPPVFLLEFHSVIRCFGQFSPFHLLLYRGTFIKSLMCPWMYLGHSLYKSYLPNRSHYLTQILGTKRDKLRTQTTSCPNQALFLPWSPRGNRRTLKQAKTDRYLAPQKGNIVVCHTT